MGAASCETTTSSPAANMRCPTPATQSPTKVMYDADLDRNLLRDQAYIEKMINHGSNNNLAQLDRRANSQDYAGVASSSAKQTIRSAIQYRQENNCPDVPNYKPVIATDVVFDGVQQ